MKDLLIVLRTGFVVTIILALVCCGFYPLVVYGLGQVLFHHKANGSLIVDSSGTVRGSRLLAQNFTGPAFFHPRPSAAGANGYDATSSGGSNWGPTSQKLRDALKVRIESYRRENGLKNTDAVPADAVTASGSGLDPHISADNARMQAERVASARKIDPGKILDLIQKHTAPRDLCIFGEPGVNVLELNLSLDAVR
ncbi:MAG: K+-transporting ATPase, subunit [Verrucomicrobiales bacterium]|nr:K+-transporting ATPase, subunit [Verrucomicrobiales bacterium]